MKEVVGSNQKTTMSVEAIMDEMVKSKRIANFAEIKLSTELAIGNDC